MYDEGEVVYDTAHQVYIVLIEGNN